MIPPLSTVPNGTSRARASCPPSPAGAISVCPLCVPSWVEDLVEGGVSRADRAVLGGEALRVFQRATDHAALVSIALPGARHLSRAELRERTRRVYDTHREIAGSAWHPARVWNFIPGITEPMVGELDRYMAFNLGRHDAVDSWFGAGDERETGRLPTASGVGHAGDDLVVHMLMLREPPESVENPRQRPAFCYSTRYGPKPPCFSRASLVELSGVRTLLIAGTASILGERSLHDGAIRDQIAETCTNLAALINAAGVDGPDPMSRFENVRVYSPDPAHDGPIGQELAGRLDGRGFELIRADLCRAELLVEIEGTAAVDDARGRGR